MNPSLLLASPGMALLFKWTCLLALGWSAHGMLRRHHARWRLILWRGILCLGLALPLARFFQMPVLKIPIAALGAEGNGFAGAVSPVAAGDPIQPAPSELLAPQTPQTRDGGGMVSSEANLAGTEGIQGPKGTPGMKVAASPISSGAKSGGISAPSKPVPWEGILLGTWALGCGCAAFRLFRLHLQLFRLRRNACRPSPDLQQLARQIQVRLNAGREVEIQISDAVTSPFLCGLINPAILLPPGLAQQLSRSELVALLSHEIAHLRQNDLAWCVAWRWMKAVCWFHPLVWKVPAVHNLACEQEADRVASQHLAGEDSYSQLLARLALRVLALPAVETKLTLNGSSQIAWRLIHLGQKGTGAWNWKHSAAGLGLLGLLFLMSAGFDFSKASPAVLPVKLVPSGPVLPASPLSDAPEAVSTDGPSPQLTFELRDGSRVVGESLKDSLGFHSPMMGNSKMAYFKLKWAGIRSVEYAGTNTDLARLTATNGDLFVITLAADAMRVETGFGQSVLPVKLIRSVKVAPPASASAAVVTDTAGLAIELRDGSHVVGKSVDDTLDFHSRAMGDMKLTWAGIRSIEDVSTNGGMKDIIEMWRLTASSGDVYEVQFAAPAVRVETSFGKTELPVKLIRSVKVSAAANGGQLSSSLAARWTGDGNAKDSTGHFDGQVSGGLSYAKGPAGQAFQFNGGDSRVDFGNSAGNFGTNDFTVAFWMKTAARTPQEGIMEKRATCDATTCFWTIDIGSAQHPDEMPVGFLGFGIAPGGNKAAYTLLSSHAVNDGQWHHIAWVRQSSDSGGSKGTIYLDGALDKSMTYPEAVDFINQAPLVLGQHVCQDHDATRPYSGAVADLQLFSQALAAEDILNIYQEGKSGK